MSIGQALAELLFPTRCFLCRTKTGGEALCPSCRARWERDKLSGKTERHPLRGVDTLCYLSAYSPNPNHAVSAYLRRAKRDYRKTAVQFAAREAAALLQRSADEVWRNVLVTYVPRSRRAVVRFGFDQSALLAEQIAAELGAECMCLLYHVGNTKQKTLMREERGRNAVRAYHVLPKAAPFVTGRRILLVDDVVTTGATASACALCLREKGCAEVTVFSMARVRK